MALKFFICMLLTGCAFLGVLCPVSHASRGVTQSEYVLFTEAKRSLDAGNLQASAKTLERYFKNSGDKHNYGYELYGMVLLNLKQYKKAVTLLEKGFAAYPKNANISQNLASAYYNTGQMLKAGQAYEKTYVLTQRKNHELAVTGAYCYMQAKRYGSAVQILKALVVLKQAKPLWFQMLGQSYFYQGNKKSAAATIEKGLARFKSDASLWRMLGYFSYELKEREKAAAAYEIAYTLKAPSKSEAEQLAALYYSLYAPFSGKRFMPLKNTPVATLDYVSTLFAQAGDFSNAVAAAHLAMKKDYSQLRQFRFGHILYQKKSTEEAAAIFRDMATGSGEYAERAQWMLVELAWDKEDWKAMLTELQSLADMQGNLAGTATQLMGVVEQLASEKLRAYAHHEKDMPLPEEEQGQP